MKDIDPAILDRLRRSGNRGRELQHRQIERELERRFLDDQIRLGNLERRLAGGGGGGHTIEDEGTPLTPRANLNFVGAGVTVTDASPDTIVTIPAAAAGTNPRFGARIHGYMAPTLMPTGTWTVHTYASGVALIFDSHGFWSSSNRSRLTVPAGGGGVYLVWTDVQFDANSTGQRLSKVAKNGDLILDAADPLGVFVAGAAASSPHFQMSFFEPYVAGDYIELWAFQDSGVSLAWGGQLGMVKLSA